MKYRGFPNNRGFIHGSTKSLYFFYPSYDELINSIQGWSVLFGHKTVLMDKTIRRVYQKLELQRLNVEHKDFRKSRSKTIYELQV